MKPAAGDIRAARASKGSHHRPPLRRIVAVS